jgi:flavin-dependent dehydrogenase
MVVGADGSKGITGKYVRGLITRRSRNQTVKQNHSPVARLLEIITPAPETAPLFNEKYAVFDFTHVNRNLQGYFWDFPARVGGEPHFNRGVFDSRFVGSAPKASLPKVLGDALEEIGTDPESVEIKGHPIHWFRPQNIFSAPHILLVGDAAGAEPLFGEGIAPALGYGRLAGKEIFDAYKKENLTFRWWIASWSYPLVKQAWFMHLFWTVGPVLSAIKNFVQRFVR